MTAGHYIYTEKAELFTCTFSAGMATCILPNGAPMKIWEAAGAKRGADAKSLVEKAAKKGKKKK